MSRPATHDPQLRTATGVAASGLRNSDCSSAATPPSAAAGPIKPQCHVNAESNKRARNESNATIADHAVAGPAAAKRPKALAPQPVPDSDAQSSFRSAAGAAASSSSISLPVPAPIPSAAVESAADPNAPAMQSHSPAQRCHTDALHCIFAFLSLQDLLPALQSCRSWRVAGCKEPPRGLTRLVQTSVARLAASPLRHHISTLTLYLSAPLRLDELQLVRALPQLTGLTAQLSEADLRARFQSAGPGPDPAGSRERRAQLLRDALPPQLQRLRLSLLFQHSAAPVCRQALVDALPTLSSLTDVSVDIHDAELDLSPLLQLPLLRRIRVDGSPQTSQCGVLKRLSALTSYTGLLCSTDALTELLQSPHSLQRLEEIEMGTTAIDSAILAALSQLPVFAVLRPQSIPPECWAGLANLPQLRKLRLAWERSFTSAQLASLSVALAQLPFLADFSIELAEDRRVDGPPLMLALPALRALCLRWLRVPSLSFLQRTPLLESLTLVKCLDVTEADLMASLRAHPLPRLLDLQIHCCVTLSTEAEAALQAPSSLLPSLTELTYFPVDE